MSVDGSFGEESSSSFGSSPEWLPCSLSLTEELLRLTPKAEAPPHASSDLSSTSTKSSDARCLCVVPLAKIVDVASSVCIFGNKLHGQVPGPAAEPGAERGAAEEPRGPEVPGLSGEDLAAPRRDRRSRLDRLIRRMPREELQCLVRDVGPYDLQQVAKSASSSASTGPTGQQQLLPPADLGGLESEDVAPDEGLAMGVAVGAFDLPPIPLARLPQTASGLPAVVKEPGGRRRAAASGKKASVFAPSTWPYARGPVDPRPLSAYDASNCQPEQALGPSIPPLPPSQCRLPSRTHREVRSHRDSEEVTAAVDARGTSFPHVLVVWTTSSVSLARSSGRTRRLQEGVPVLVAFASEVDAVAVRDALLLYRAARLDEEAPPEPAPGRARHVLGEPSPRFGSAADSAAPAAEAPDEPAREKYSTSPL